MSVDVNSPDFAERFNKKDAVVGVIGQGFVGGTMKAYFEHHGMRVVAHDKFRPEFGSLAGVVSQSDVVFVCVPTPMKPTGECHTDIVVSVLDDIVAASAQLGRPGDTFVVCLKSTVPPGFTKRMQRQFPTLRITFSPEYLTEKSAYQDMVRATRVVVGGDYDDTKIVLQFFLEADRRRVDEGKLLLVAVADPAAAEMAKLFANGLLFAKVMFCNDVYLLCQRLGIDYEEARAIAVLDPRIGPSHTHVPGHDGFKGFSGSCGPKDINNLIALSRQHGVSERMFTAVWERNKEVRKKHDWNDLVGRAVVDK